MASKKIMVPREEDIRYSLEGKTLKDASEFLMSIHTKYPSDAYIDVGLRDNYGEEAYVVVRYRSEETDEEISKRLAREALSQEYRKKQFEQLKKEFGDK